MKERNTQAKALKQEIVVVGPPHSEEPSLSASSESLQMYESFLQGAQNLAERLHHREQELLRIVQITEHVNYGVLLEQVLDSVYQEMQDVIPYNRIGFSLIDEDRNAVVARWAKSDRPMLLKQGYEAELEGSTLQRIIQAVQPRIINDLEAYLNEKPKSASTRAIVQEGMRSSLTCPLIIKGKPVGFIFFSSVEKGTYSNVHVAFFQQIAGQLASIVEKGRLYNELAEKNAIIEQQNLEMTHDLEMAWHVQQALIPNKDLEFEFLDVGFDYEAAVQVGGDILDIIPIGASKVLLFLGDAMGHGVQAALVMSVVKAALSSAVQSDPNPASVLGSINTTIARLFDDRFVTAACCLMDSEELRAELALAGHAGPLWYHANTREVSQTTEANLPLGIDGETKYQTTSIVLRKGDALVFSTDGIEEAFDSSGNQYGIERLKDQVLRSDGATARELCSSVRRDLDAHCADHPRADDFSLLVLKIPENLSASTAKP